MGVFGSLSAIGKPLNETEFQGRRTTLPFSTPRLDAFVFEFPLPLLPELPEPGVLPVDELVVLVAAGVEVLELVPEFVAAGVEVTAEVDELVVAALVVLAAGVEVLEPALEVLVAELLAFALLLDAWFEVFDERLLFPSNALPRAEFSIPFQLASCPFSCTTT